MTSRGSIQPELVCIFVTEETFWKGFLGRNTSKKDMEVLSKKEYWTSLVVVSWLSCSCLENVTSDSLFCAKLLCSVK